MTKAMETSLSLLLAALSQLKHRAALVGGLAVSARTEPRFTRDIDLAVAVTDDAAAEALIRGLSTIGWTPFFVSEQQGVGRLATVRLVRLGQDPHGSVSDLLFASSGIEGEIVEAAENMEIFPGLYAPVAGIGHLIALKLLARDDKTRPQDLGDLHALMRAASTADLTLARAAIALIAQRGFDRGRNLEEALGAVQQLLKE